MTKPIGYFNFLLAIDCESTGLSYNNVDPSVGHQALSWGLVVVNADTLTPIEKMYIEIKWNEESVRLRQENPSYGTDAEKVHGLTYSYLEQHGVDEQQAVLQIGQLILKYWGPKNSIRTLGHNVSTFDIPFLRAMFNRHGVELRFGNRHYDSASLGFGTLGTYNSDDLFQTLGFEKRQKHNALDDALFSLDAFRIIRTLWQSKVQLYYEEQ